jgi:hypothetical protein
MRPRRRQRDAAERLAYAGGGQAPPERRLVVAPAVESPPDALRVDGVDVLLEVPLNRRAPSPRLRAAGGGVVPPLDQTANPVRPRYVTLGEGLLHRDL